MMPISSVIPKSILPVADGSDKISTVLQTIYVQVVSAGIERIGVIVSPWQLEMVHRYFTALRESSPSETPVDLQYIIQASPSGFGDAILCALDFVGQEPFMVLLGDHIYIEEPDAQTCTVQVAMAFESMGGVAMVGVQPVSIEKLSTVGVVRGTHIQENIYRCTDIVEKPDQKTADERLVTDGLPKGLFLAHCGIYVLTPEIFAYLLHMQEDLQGELELTVAQAILLKVHPNEYFLCRIAGRAYDIGTPSNYAKAQIAFRNRK